MSDATSPTDPSGATPAPHPGARPTAIVTGASGGIGYEIARALARHGFDLHLVSRGGARGSAARDAVAAEARDGADVRFHPADLASLEDVRRVASDLADAAPTLDLLVNNAGAYVHQRALTEDGYERTFALNHLSPFLLTHLLRAPLAAADAPRVVTTSSSAERSGPIDLERAAYGVPYNALRAYGWSKQANVHFARELARRAPHPALRSYAFHPGFVNTNFGSGSGLLSGLVALAQRAFGRTPEQGAATGVWAATAAPAPDPNGAFLVDEAVKAPSAAAQDEAVTAALWQRSETWVGLRDDERWPRREGDA